MASIAKPTWGPQPETLLNAKLNAMVDYTRDRVRFVGDWNSATAYEINDLVTSGGGKWLALIASTNSTPVEGAGWTSFNVATPTGATNLFYATPNGTTGAATLRAIVGADLPTGTMIVKGALQLAASGSATAGRAVAADDSRLTLVNGLFLPNLASAPATPTGGAVIYAMNGAVWAKGSSGTPTQIAAP